MRRFTWVPFAVALLAFVLPFATVSCDQLHVETSGAELVLRASPETQGPNEEGVELGGLVVEFGGGLATASFLAFALALVASLRGWSPGWVPLCGLAGIAALAFLETRTGGAAAGGVVDVDARFGAVLAAGTAALGALAGALTWLRTGGAPSLRPFTPVLGAGLLVLGYLLPSNRSDAFNVAYADSLNVRDPHSAALWVLAPAVGMLLLARRRTLTRLVASLALGVLTVAGIAVSEDIWSASRDDRLKPGIASFVLLAGVLVSGRFAARVARRDRAGRPVAAPPAPAPAPTPAPAPDAPSAQGAAGSPPEAR